MTFGFTQFQAALFFSYSCIMFKWNIGFSNTNQHVFFFSFFIKHFEQHKGTWCKCKQKRFSSVETSPQIRWLQFILAMVICNCKNCTRENEQIKIAGKIKTGLWWYNQVNFAVINRISSFQGFTAYLQPKAKTPVAWILLNTTSLFTDPEAPAPAVTETDWLKLLCAPASKTTCPRANLIG